MVHPLHHVRQGATFSCGSAIQIVDLAAENRPTIMDEERLRYTSIPPLGHTVLSDDAQ